MGNVGQCIGHFSGWPVRVIAIIVTKDGFWEDFLVEVRGMKGTYKQLHDIATASRRVRKGQECTFLGEFGIKNTTYNATLAVGQCHEIIIGPLVFSKFGLFGLINYTSERIEMINRNQQLEKILLTN